MVIPFSATFFLEVILQVSLKVVAKGYFKGKRNSNISIFEAIFLKQKRWRLSKTITIPDKMCETNSSFHVKYRTTGKVKFPFSRSFVLVLTKFSFWKEGGTLCYNLMQFRYFPDISWFPKIINRKSFSNS